MNAQSTRDQLLDYVVQWAHEIRTLARSGPLFDSSGDTSRLLRPVEELFRTIAAMEHAEALVRHLREKR